MAFRGNVAFIVLPLSCFKRFDWQIICSLIIAFLAVFTCVTGLSLLL